MTAWLTAQQAAAHATQARQTLSAGTAAVTVRTVYSWVRRGHLTAKGMDDEGRRLYDYADVARAELRTRARALRLVGIGEAEPHRSVTDPSHRTHKAANPDTLTG